jgi:hypothetical protein
MVDFLPPRPPFVSVRHRIQHEEDFTIPRRPTLKSLESLNLTLQNLEQTQSPGKDDAGITELKRVLLNRIADLELSKTLETEDDKSDKAPEPADLVPPPSITEEGALEEDIDKASLDKLD